MNLRTFLASSLILLAFGLTPSAYAVGTYVVQGDNGASRCTSAEVGSLAALEFTLCIPKTLYRVGEKVVQTSHLTNLGPGPFTFALDMRNEVFLRTDNHCFRLCVLTEEDSILSLAPG